ncbi:MAG: cytochrome c [Actinobacteria bacterium]|nr:cytochrome c [Actinomycetota bacterium]
MPLALTGYEIGLLSVAVVFMIFALVAALVVPRRRPEFPSKYLGWFIAACIVLFAGQMTAVLLLAELGEEEEVAHESEPGETTETTPTETTPTEPTSTETTPTSGATETTEGQGDPVGGKEVFLGAPACGSCHTLGDAGTSGTIGPNLDATSPSYAKVVERVTNGQGVMPSFKDTLSEQQIQDVAAYVSSVAG